MIDPLELNDPAFSVAVPSVCVEPNTRPNADMLDTDEITPLVIDPLVDREPAVSVAVASEKIALVTVADVLSEPAFKVVVPSVNVAPNT